MLRQASGVPAGGKMTLSAPPRSIACSSTMQNPNNLRNTEMEQQ
jgi:hypothetical protein